MKAIVLALLVSTAGSAQALDIPQQIKENRAAIKAFGGQLKGELKKGMKAGGPVNAIGVCNLQAPVIASQVSSAKGIEVARTSLKLRNPGNAPDAWEHMVLRQFEMRKRAGEDVSKMDYFSIMPENGKPVFRYMKAIGTEAICTTCHGTDIDAKVVEKLDSLYPLDQARGFKAGDIRGAFTLKSPL